MAPQSRDDDRSSGRAAEAAADAADDRTAANDTGDDAADDRTATNDTGDDVTGGDGGDDQWARRADPDQASVVEGEPGPPQQAASAGQMP